MKKALLILIYFTNVINAITKGAKVIYENWPSSNPFKHSNNDVSFREQQSQPNQPDSDIFNEVEKLEPIPDSTSETGKRQLH